MSRNLKKIALVFAAFLLILGSLPFMSLNTAKAEDTAGTDKITIGTIKNTAAMPAVMANADTQFTTSNVTVEVKSFDSNNELNDAVKNGTVNVAVSNLVSYASIIKTNPSWKIAGTLPGYYGLVANKKYKSIKSLKGKTIAVDKKDTSYQYLKTVLKKNKMKLSSIKVKQIDGDNTRVDSLKSGEIDAAVMEDPSLSVAKGNGAKILNRQKVNNDNGNVLIINNDFAKTNRSSVLIIIDVMNHEIKSINKLGNYMMASDALKAFGATGKAAEYMNNMNVKFKKIHKVKKSCYNKEFKYAKKQKLYKGRVNYKDNTLKLNNVK